MTTPSDLPEAAQRRLAEGSFSSGLSVADFAACLAMGLEPAGLVQGFCAMQWGSYLGGTFMGRGVAPYGGSQGGYVQNYQCPHGVITAEHRMWGQNYQQTWIESAWTEGFSSAFSRMIDEARELGAHGVVGVVDTENPLVDAGIVEFHVRGTAVRLLDAPSPVTPWSTYLAGQRLAKIFEAGYAPVEAVASISSVRVWSSCVTEYLLEGTGGVWSMSAGVTEVEQMVSAQSAAREIVRSSVRAQLRGDALHGADLSVAVREFSRGDLEIQARLSGNRIRRVKEFEALGAPRVMVTLS